MSPEKNLTYFLFEGGFLDAATPLGMVNSLRQHHGMGDMHHEDFMSEMAQHYQKKGHVIRTDSVTHFVYDLINTGSVLLPVPLPEYDVLGYAKLYMEVAVSEFLPANEKLEVLIDFYPVDKQTTGLRVRVRGFWEMAAIQVERVFSPNELLADLGSWKAKAAQFNHQIRYGS